MGDERERSPRSAVLACALSMAAVLCLAGCSQSENTEIALDGEMLHRFSERCQSDPEGTSVDLSGVFDVEWDSITFATPGASYGDIADASGASWSEEVKQRTVFDQLIVLTRDGVALKAYDAEGAPFRIVGENADVWTVPFPGTATIERMGCSFDASATI